MVARDDVFHVILGICTRTCKRISNLNGEFKIGEKEMVTKVISIGGKKKYFERERGTKSIFVYKS